MIVSLSHDLFVFVFIIKFVHFCAYFH